VGAPVIVLGIETSTATSSVCIGDESGTLAAAELTLPAKHAEFLLPAIRFCLDQAGLGIDDVSGVAVGLGPGLYTGMRVGLATAQSFAHARSLPCVGHASLDLMAYAVRWVRADRIVCPVVDARRGELFWAMYRPAIDGVQRVTEFRVGPPERLGGEIEALAEDVLCVGGGALVHHGLLEAAGASVGSVGTAHPDARHLVELAHARFVREETQRPEDLRPIYLRKPDARINWQGRGALHGGRGQTPTGAAAVGEEGR
jgi:tRNA threonylcarbamoyladenosine biosynthesis protein TsaB